MKMQRNLIFINKNFMFEYPYTIISTLLISAKNTAPRKIGSNLTKPGDENHGGVLQINVPLPSRKACFFLLVIISCFTFQQRSCNNMHYRTFCSGSAPVHSSFCALWPLQHPFTHRNLHIHKGVYKSTTSKHRRIKMRSLAHPYLACTAQAIALSSKPSYTAIPCEPTGKIAWLT